MKLNALLSLCILSTGIFFTKSAVCASYHQIGYPGDASTSFVFVENNTDDNSFLASVNQVSDARIGLIGANRWTAIKGTAGSNQTELGKLKVSNATGSVHLTDIWISGSPVTYPLIGQACSLRYSDCDAATGVNPPKKIDNYGFYGSSFGPEDTNARGGVLSDTFYQYLRQMAAGNSFTITADSCMDTQTNAQWYGGDCATRDYSSHNRQTLTSTKAAHLKLINTNEVDEVFINSDGKPTPAEGNINCVEQTIGSQSGLACKMVSYSLQSNGENLSGIQFYPMLTNSSLASTVGTKDMQISLSGSSWRQIPAIGTIRPSTANSYTLEEMKSSDALYVFFSESLFKQLVTLGISDVNSRDLFVFRTYSTDDAGNNYAFNTSNSLEIKPREFSINISSEDYSDAPTREGYVGSSQPSLDFNYIVTTSGKTAADEVLIKVTGPTQELKGRPYCVFSSDDGTARVPFPATLSFTRQDGSINTYDVGCDGSWRDMTDALWISSAWTDISGEAGVMDKATVKFSILMNDIISMRTLDNNSGWYGDISASGEIHVQATWRDIN